MPKSVKFNPETDKVIIEIPGRRKAGGSGKRPTRGPLESPGPLKFLPRRPAQSGVKFFDTAQIGVDGLFSTTNFLVQAPFGAVDNTTEYPPDVVDLSGVNDAALAVDLADWPTTFFPIEKGLTHYEQEIRVEWSGGNDTLNNLSQWKDKGLELSAAEWATAKITATGVLFGTYIDFTGADSKFCLTNDVDDPGVAFVPSVDMQIFLIPQPIFNAIEADYQPSGFPHVVYQRRNAQTQLLPRHQIEEYHGIVYGDSYWEKWQYIRIIDEIDAEFGHSRGSQTIDGVRTDITAASIPEISVFPPAFGAGDSPTAEAVFLGVNFVFQIDVLAPAGFESFKAVIKQGGIWYYVFDI